MNIGPLPAAGAAGLPLAQTKGSAVELAQEALGARGRRVYHENKAEAAAGVGQPDGEDHETHQRDADGGRDWESQPEPDALDRSSPTRQTTDPSGQSGQFLDLTG
jgi:hypothetical protein